MTHSENEPSRSWRRSFAPTSDCAHGPGMASVDTRLRDRQFVKGKNGGDEAAGLQFR